MTSPLNFWKGSESLDVHPKVVLDHQLELGARSAASRLLNYFYMSKQYQVRTCFRQIQQISYCCSTSAQSDEIYQDRVMRYVRDRSR